MKILINGACGRMGKVVTQRGLAGYCNCEGIVRVDKHIDSSDNGEILGNISDCKEKIDCIIDFSLPTGTKDLLNYATENNIPIVIATTGHNSDELQMIEEASQKIAIFKSGNMSIGIATLATLAGQVAKILPDANVEIIETHHNQKLDVPSGTALMLAESIKKERENSYFNVGRHEYGKRESDEIGIHSIRLGNVIGEHEILINTGSETISLKHQAHTRDLFAEGSLIAAQFIKDKPSGMYNMYNIVG